MGARRGAWRHGRPVRRVRLVRPTAGDPQTLLVGDLTALPAIGRILEELPATMHAHVIAEAVGSADEQQFTSPATSSTEWLRGTGNGLGPSILGDAIREHPDFEYVWFAGEAAVARDVRKWLRHELGRTPESYHVMGYWRDDKEAWTARYEKVRTHIETVADRAIAEGNGLESVRDAVDAAMEQAGL
ncbi:siderophore-interacting protein [Rhodococcus sp. NPDC058521]|uniref:siderophore-interacting protein n=1 Tax=Rhodococcus sp. NPDC058521 TaxID=3346536 RepID=UPI0036535470